MQQYCYNCMQKLGDSPVCGSCGYDNNNPSEVSPYHMLPGSVLANKYLVGNVLGEGGFGITYIGLDTVLSKRVAIKEFYPSGAANRTNSVSEKVIVTKGKESFFTKGVQRFLFEAKNVAAFYDEEGVVDVLDYFQANGTAYIVMEYVDGETLKHHVNTEGRFEADKLITLLLPVMKSLSYMHTKGIIHRDISPDNIMLTKRGKMKLMDFGSARYYTNEEREMSVILKQGFAPEEQYRRNGEQGPYTDVYALCATIYACITGSIPDDSLDRLANDTLKPPSKLGVQMLPHQERALMHGLALRSKDRTPDMDTLIKEFTTPVRGYQTTPNPAARPQQPIKTTPSYRPTQQQPVKTTPSYRPTQQQPVKVTPSYRPTQQQPVKTTPSYRPARPAGTAPVEKTVQQPVKPVTSYRPAQPAGSAPVEKTVQQPANPVTSYRPAHPAGSAPVDKTVQQPANPVTSYRPAQPQQPAQAKPAYQPSNPSASSGNKKPLIIIAVVLAVLVIAGIVTGIVISANSKGSKSSSGSSASASNIHTITGNTGVKLIEDNAIDTSDSSAQVKIQEYITAHPEAKTSMNSSMNGNGEGDIYARGNAMVYEVKVSTDVTDEQKSALSSYLESMKSSLSSSLSQAKSESGVSNMVIVIAYIDNTNALLASTIVK